MTGTGGDELFSNYDKYRGLEERRHFALACRLQRQAPALSRAASFASGLRRRLRAPWLRDDPGRDLRQVHRREDGPLFWRYPFGLSFPTAHGRGFNERVAARPAEGLSAGRWVLERTFQAYAGACLRDRCVAVDFNNQLPDEFLHMTDRFAMAFSLEARTPFLDKEFAGFVLGLDARVRLTPDDPKSVFKRAVRPWLPEGHADRVKRGFVIPAARWLRGALRPQAEELFSESALRRDGLVRADFRTACYAPFLAGQTQLAETVWTVFMFRLWQEHVGRYGGSAEGRG
jgi:asparagine synthase (glutamine-hydrolysing)